MIAWVGECVRQGSWVKIETLSGASDESDILPWTCYNGVQKLVDARGQLCDLDYPISPTQIYLSTLFYIGCSPLKYIPRGWTRPLLRQSPHPFPRNTLQQLIFHVVINISWLPHIKMITVLWPATIVTCLKSPFLKSCFKDQRVSSAASIPTLWCRYWQRLITLRCNIWKTFGWG